ncbi:farnesyl diphosphate synthase [Gloeopeniophorella convolvens]|nr:farnesyl diphosphate synthase [Gloeopeniophorella convolvens]
MAPIATSTVPEPAAVAPAPAKDKAAARKRFEDVYTIVRDDLLADFRKHNMPEEAIDYYRRSMDYNVPGGKLNRGLSVVDSVAIFMGRELTDAEYFKAAVLGWSVEWLQAYFLVSDDIMDSSVTRRGQPCWYKLKDVGLMAINDALILEGAIYQMIRKHFRSEPYYVDLLDLMHEVSYQTEMGQLVDLITAPEDHVDLSKFSLDRHKTIVIYKTAIYSFYLPVALAMLLCGFPLALDILVPLGEYFQIQDDYLDYAGTPEQIGKIGTDILDNKCSWVVNTALARATPAQRTILDANYGRKDPDAEARVKAVFAEADAYARINALIDAVPEASSPCGGAVLRRSVFRVFLEKIYKRTK